MPQIILGTLIAFLAIVGVTELFHLLGDTLLRPPAGKVRFVLVSRGHDEQIEYTIRSIAFRARAFSSSETMPLIVVVDGGMDDETKKICDKLMQTLPCMEIRRSDELPVLFD